MLLLNTAARTTCAKREALIRLRSVPLIAILVLLLYLVTVLMMTYPLVDQIDARLPFDLGDPLYMGWVISWNNHFLINQDFSLSTLFNTNIYFPYKNTLAYSDLMLIPSIMVSPVFYLTRNPVITVNALLFLLLALDAFAMFLLAKQLTKNTLAAILAGFFYTFSAYHLAQIGHIQLHADAFMLLMLMYLHKWLNDNKPKYMVLAALMLFLEALSSWYYAIYAGILFLLFFGFFFIFKRIKITRGGFISFAIGALVLVALLYPFIHPYLTLHKTMPNFERTVGETAVYAAAPTDYLYTVERSVFWGQLLGFSRPGVENILFPGFAVILLAVAGLGGLLKSVKARAKTGQIKLFYLIVSFIAFVYSLGPYKIILGRKVPLPFFFAFHLLPGFKSMRVPARFGLLVLLGLTILAAFGITRLLEFWQEKRKKGRRADLIAVIVLAFVIFQQVSWSIPLSQPIASGDQIPPIYKWLAKDTKSEVIIELPPSGSEQVKYVHYSSYHSKQLVNGYSGYTPPLWADLESRVSEFPAIETIEFLRELGVDGVLVHSKLIPGSEKKLEAPWPKNVRLIKKVSGDYFFDISGPPAKDQAVPIKLNE